MLRAVSSLGTAVEHPTPDTPTASSSRCETTRQYALQERLSWDDDTWGSRNSTTQYSIGLDGTPFGKKLRRGWETPSCFTQSKLSILPSRRLTWTHRKSKLLRPRNLPDRQRRARRESDLACSPAVQQCLGSSDIMIEFRAARPVPDRHHPRTSHQAEPQLTGTIHFDVALGVR